MADEATDVVEEATDENYKNPLGVTAEEESEDVVRVCIIFPALKKKKLRNQCANGTLDVKVEERSLSVIFTMKNKDKEEKFRYFVKQFPDDVDKSATKQKIKDGQVVLYLKKQNSKSWAKELSESGLETYAVEDEDEEK